MQGKPREARTASPLDFSRNSVSQGRNAAITSAPGALAASDVFHSSQLRCGARRQERLSPHRVGEAPSPAAILPVFLIGGADAFYQGPQMRLVYPE